MAYIDMVQEFVDLVKDEWIIANTNSKRPNIDKITKYPFDMDYSDGKGYIVVYSSAENESMPGIGQTSKADVEETIKVDIRVLKDETYFNKVKTELKRILYTNRVLGTTNICNFDIDNKPIVNLSNRQKLFFREVRDVGLRDYNRDYTN